MDYTNILVEKNKTSAIVTLNRPQALNALNKTMLEELLFCLTKLSRDKTIKVVILTGAGENAFVAGADIAFMQDLTSNEGKLFGRLGQTVTRTIENLPQPVIAAVNGFAMGGGCELALSCDIRLASDNAKFGLPEVKLGVIPGFGGTQRLPRLIGKGLACELLYSGKVIDAAEARRIGLVNRVVPQEKLMEECLALAALIGSRGPAAVQLCKEVVNNGMEMDLTRACSYEADLFGLCFGGDEQKEGMAAFLEKRSPDFQKTRYS
ncbi:enoyl-CoA hydratase/isomerase family protein [Desulforhopalus vacuolatus]|uniref:enoyl-CoA hydratase-related protein n=1 Tax=Desulforhopalus vacuolatus TaxID=40414 RepID=UPI001964DB50|nr:enoyl-CoA hydratase/isomerase family protein [Desulforhopalus vacuolatus]